MPFRKRGGWLRWLGLAAIPLVIAASLLGLLMGVTGLCVGLDDMQRTDHPMTLCLFFCGAIVTPVALLIALLIVLAALYDRTRSLPVSAPASIFHPPTALAA